MPKDQCAYVENLLEPAAHPVALPATGMTTLMPDGSRDFGIVFGIMSGTAVNRDQHQKMDNRSELSHDEWFARLEQAKTNLEIHDLFFECPTCSPSRVGIDFVPILMAAAYCYEPRFGYKPLIAAYTAYEGLDAEAATRKILNAIISGKPDRKLAMDYYDLYAESKDEGQNTA